MTIKSKISTKQNWQEKALHHSHAYHFVLRYKKWKWETNRQHQPDKDVFSQSPFCQRKMVDQTIHLFTHPIPCQSYWTTINALFGGCISKMGHGNQRNVKVSVTQTNIRFPLIFFSLYTFHFWCSVIIFNKICRIGG